MSMAGSPLSILLEYITQLLIQDVGLIREVGDQIRSLQVELTVIHQFLCDIKGKGELVEEVAREIQSITQEAEDVLDTLFIEIAKQKRRNALEKFFKEIVDNFQLQHVARKLEGIKNRIEIINNNNDKHKNIDDISEHEEEDEEDTRVKRLYAQIRHVNEDNVVSFDEEAETVKAMLSNTNQRLDVVSIIGIGGLGKTKLAKKIYNDNDVKDKFKCRAWVCASQKFHVRDMLLQILQSVAESTQSIYEMTDRDLVAALKTCLRGKRYLIVLDDVWTPEVWDCLKGAFPNTNDCSRILLTSQIEEVASHASPTPPYFLRLLNNEESWKLLSTKAFCGEACPPTLKTNIRYIAEQCGGIPLALLVVGGLLMTREKSTLVLSRMVDNVNWYLGRNTKDLQDVLALSYEELLSHLKPCFLYIGTFPEDYEMSARQLMRLWVVKGLIERDTRRNLEDIADDYLQDLADRSLITVVKRRGDGAIKSCIIHDLVRDMCIAEAARDNLFRVHYGNGIVQSLRDRPQRISFQCTTSGYASSSHLDSSKVLTLLCFGDKEAKSKLSVSMYFPVLWELDPGQTFFNSTPFKKLFLLRYLCIQGVVFSNGIPLVISNLPKLQILDLRESKVMFLRNNFWNMQQLRHLFLGGSCHYAWTSNSLKFVKTMPNLQTLSGINALFAFEVRNTNAFPNLRKLGVQSDQFVSYPCFTGLSSSESNAAYCNVQALKLTVGSHFLPLCNVFPPMLTKLTLISTEILSSHFSKIRIPNLEILKLMKDSIVLGDDDYFEVNRSFTKLKVLHMVELKVRQWCVGDQSFCNLDSLVISKCDLEPIPGVLSEITTLRSIKASSCKPAFNESLRTLGDDIYLEIQ